MFSLLWGMLFCKRSFKKHFPLPPKQWNIRTGGKGFLSSLYVKILSRGLVPCCQAHMTVLLEFFQSVRQLPSNSDPKYLSYFWGVILKTVCHTDTVTRENSPTLTSDTNSPTPASQHQRLTFEDLLLFFFAAGDLEKGVKSERGGRVMVLELSSAGCSVELLLFRSPELQFSLLPALFGVGMSTCLSK